MSDGLWYFSDRLAVPSDLELRRRILWEFHRTPDMGHLGADKLYAILRRSFWWPNMARTVRQYVAHCEDCQRNKPRTTLPGGLGMPIPVARIPWEEMQLDFVTGFQESEGFNAIAVFVDRFSKMIIVAPCTKEITAPEVANLFIKYIYSRFGLPKIIISDRDVRFTANFWQQIFKCLGTKLNMSTAFHPQSDGLTERANRTILEMLRSFVNPRQTNWVQLLPLMEFAYNNSVNASTGFSPFYLNYGRHPHTAILRAIGKRKQFPAVDQWLKDLMSVRLEAVKNNLAAQKSQAKAMNKSRKDVSFSVGDKVLLDSINLKLPAHITKKLSARFIGPFTVTAIVNKNALKLDLPKNFGRTHNVFNVGLLKLFLEDPDSTGQRPLSILVNGQNEFWVDQILGESKGTGPKRYLVLWKGYPPEEASWVNRKVVDPLEAFQKFLDLRK